MIVHKQYQCEYCFEEFDDENECFEHELKCNYKAEFKKCASCGYGNIINSYGVPQIKCCRLMGTGDSCDGWRCKK